MEDVEAIIDTTKQYLEFLHIELMETEKKAVKEIINTCSEGCKNLKKLVYSGPEAPVEKSEENCRVCRYITLIWKFMN